MIFIQYTEKLFVKPSMLVELKKHTYNKMLKLFLFLPNASQRKDWK